MANNQNIHVFARDLKDLGGLSVAQVRGRRRRRALAAGLTASTIILAAWLGGVSNASQDDEAPPVNLFAAPTLVALSENAPLAAIADLDEDLPQSEPELTWHSHRIQRGDTLAKIFAAAGVTRQQTARITSRLPRNLVRGLRPGRGLEIGIDDAGQPRSLEFDLDDRSVLKIVVDGDEINVEEQPRELDIEHRFASGIIRSSLFQAGAEAGLADRQILELASIFGWDIDFALDLREGDRFVVAYEELFTMDGGRIGRGEIVAAQFVNSGRTHHAVRHVDEDGHTQYFTPDGKSLRGTFLRTPVRFSRVTSGFTKRRFHPVLKKWRAHKGVDYGAPSGTPVLATADGRVRFVGRHGGYGKTVRLSHGGAYSTLYAHLSRYKRGLRQGAVVKQGDVIGYVGSTGLATGPHLHYEFRVHGQHRNPLTFQSPKKGGIDKRYRDVFLAEAQEWVDKISVYSNTEVASNE
ncbi:MAG: peptidoglycan DD-metalloendopeptidase family protein [Gammaproteobacteria bacterium]|nr:peptidoglycan DD-metalloendopeptidase family protein [Gammaproteobacteria bacterium]